MTFDEAKGLKYGQIIYHLRWTNADGTPQRWMVNGKVKLWKTRPNDIEIPIKRGMWQFSYLSQMPWTSNLTDFFLTEEEVNAQQHT